MGTPRQPALKRRRPRLKRTWAAPASRNNKRRKRFPTMRIPPPPPDYLRLLPRVILGLIRDNLAPKDVARLRRTCSDLRDLKIDTCDKDLLRSICSSERRIQEIPPDTMFKRLSMQGRPRKGHSTDCRVPHKQELWVAEYPESWWPAARTLLSFHPAFTCLKHIFIKNIWLDFAGVTLPSLVSIRAELAAEMDLQTAYLPKLKSVHARHAKVLLSNYGPPALETVVVEGHVRQRSQVPLIEVDGKTFDAQASVRFCGPCPRAPSLRSIRALGNCVRFVAGDDWGASRVSFPKLREVYVQDTVMSMSHSALNALETVHVRSTSRKACRNQKRLRNLPRTSRWFVTIVQSAELDLEKCELGSLANIHLEGGAQVYYGKSGPPRSLGSKL